MNLQSMAQALTALAPSTLPVYMGGVPRGITPVLPWLVLNVRLPAPSDYVATGIATALEQRLLVTIAAGSEDAVNTVAGWCFDAFDDQQVSPEGWAPAFLRRYGMPVVFEDPDVPDSATGNPVWVGKLEYRLTACPTF